MFDRKFGRFAVLVLLFATAGGYGFAQPSLAETVEAGADQWVFFPGGGGPDPSGYLLSTSTGDLWVINGAKRKKVTARKGVTDVSARECGGWSFYVGPGRTRYSGYLMCDSSGELWKVDGDNLVYVSSN